MSEIRINSIKIKNYRSFGDEQTFIFPGKEYKNPIAIVGYNNSGKTNLMNAILYGIGLNYVSANHFEKKDLHNLDYQNHIEIKTDIDGTSYYSNGYSTSIKGKYKVFTRIEDGELFSKVEPSFFGKHKHYNIFYINFHNIKSEISTKKTSWGHLTSFLAKHIQKIIDTDENMKLKREFFEIETKEATEKVLKNSRLNRFIQEIKKNYSTNLRDNNCKIDFGLPDYEDIFLQMEFKVGLNGDLKNPVPIDHFGDGYISMFVMAVIQAIAESNTEDKCLFLFEEPESFLHENHQEYFYKMVLCNLAERGHQVIYTTHSDKMVDIFDTKGLIRIEYDEDKKQTVKKYNNTTEFSASINDFLEEKGEIITLEKYNQFIKTVEPNLNKILFSRKVVLVEGPNDVMSYKYAIEKKVADICKDPKYANAYLNFNNIAIIPHHGKSTALLLIKLCQHICVDYFVISDWDFNRDFVRELANFSTEEKMKQSSLYEESSNKGMVTTNWKLLHYAGKDNIHFNIPKLEDVIGYKSNNKDSVKIWNTLNNIEKFSEGFFPRELEEFLEITKLGME